MNEKIIEKILEIALTDNKTSQRNVDNHIGKYCIVRTNRAGVFFGKIKEKDGAEVIIDECRRLWYWKTVEGISLSEVANKGLHDDSKVCDETNNHWAEAIELIECSDISTRSIKGMKVYVN